MELLLVLLFAGVLIYAGYHFVLKDPLGVKTEDKPADPAPVASDKPVVESVVANVLDVNKDGKVDLADAKAAVTKTKARVKKAADVDGDGKVTKADAKAAVKTVAKKVRANKSKA